MATTKQDVEIREVRVKDIYQYACDAFRSAPGQDEVNPIPRLRALAWSKNPQAEAEDPALFVAYLGAKCIGYLGVFPVVFTKGQEREKLFCLSTWYVLPAHRNTGAGAYLLTRAMSLKENMFVVYPTEDAEKVYRAIRFKPFGPMRYAMLHMGILNLLGLPFEALNRLGPRNAALSSWTAGIARITRRILYPGLKRIAYAALLSRVGKRLRDVEYTKLDALDDDLCRWAEQDDALTPRVHRGPETINWMLEHPWIGEDLAQATPKYEFSDMRVIFKYVAYRVVSRSDGATRGFLVLSVSERADGERVVKLLDHGFARPDDAELAIGVALEYARGFGADRVLLPWTTAAKVLKGVVPRALTWKKEGACFAYCGKRQSLFAREYASIQPGLCDGDTAFT